MSLCSEKAAVEPQPMKQGGSVPLTESSFWTLPCDAEKMESSERKSCSEVAV